ncbi:hypothetical protein LBMAG42_43650 [Deltaproteobacteria bacterium]|nr:hypothetical protein LBMAG42_43650 [Deltaproteobacteria bacterium]
MILFVRGGALGDFVLTLPALAACFATGRRVDVACAPRHRPLVRLVGEPGRFWDLDGTESLWMFGGVDPVGYTDAVCFAEGRTELPIPTIHAVGSRPPARVPAWKHFMGALPPGWPTPDPGLRLHAPPLRPDRPIVLAPGASDSGRSWPLSEWFRLAETLRPHAPVVLVGGPSEPWAEYRPDLSELIRLAASAGAWLGPDSGPTHLAARMGAPTFAVFRTTDPGWAPYGAEIVQETVLDRAESTTALVHRLLVARGCHRDYAPV